MLPFTRNLLIANVVVFLTQSYFHNAGFEPLMLWPLGEQQGTGFGGHWVTVGFMPWQLVTYAFLHGGPSHLLMNMFGLWMFGSAIEQAMGTQRFAMYYFASVIGAGLLQLLVTTISLHSGGDFYPTIGASGGLFGILLAYGLFFPNNRVFLIFFPVPIRARTFVILYGAAELFFGVTGTVEGVAHFAHLGGMLAGWLLIQYWRRRPPPNRRFGA